MSSTGSQKRVPVIHIGLPKTATKTLQWRLFAGHSEIYYLGRFDGPVFNGQYIEFDACRDRSVQSIMKQVAYDNIDNPDFPRCRKTLSEVLAPAHERNLLPVWSWESYSTDILDKRRVRARNLKEVFGEARIIMTLRNPVTLLESTYFQILKRDNVGARGHWGMPPYYVSIDDWLETEFNREVLPHLQYAETLQAYIEQFGIDNVSVFLFEELLADKRAFSNSVCAAMGIDPDEGCQLMEANTDNERWTASQLEALKQVKGSFFKSLRFRYTHKHIRRQILDMGKKSGTHIEEPKARAPISAGWQRRIYEFVEQGNRWIEENFDLPLDKHGYFGNKD